MARRLRVTRLEKEPAMSDSPSNAATFMDGNLNCPACQAIDKADGSEDGRLYRAVGRRVKNERALVERFKRGEDRAADSITGFAGSLNFVYLHAAWFVLWILVNIGLFSLRK